VNLARARSVLGTIVVAIALCAGGVLVYWNVFGQGGYGESCRFSLGCKSFLCAHHAVAGEAQPAAPGRCTKSCERDDECGAGARCVVLTADTRDDLPPFGKPDRACLATAASTPSTPNTP